MSPKKIEISLNNLTKALSSLQEFIGVPIVTRRDIAGVIQAFKFTYEQFWKTFKKVAEFEKFDVQSPRQAIDKAFQLGLISPDEEEHWVNMIKTRSETNHTYNEDQARVALEKIVKIFYPLFQETFQRLTNRLINES